jgi:glycosyltransferase involved in cell wall biosynthesis
LNPAAAGSIWLSVVIPSYRGERWIEMALASIARERAPGIEVLLIDSGPSGETRARAADFADRLRIRILDRPDLSSWQTKTNLGVALAEATHVCWLGVDDVWLPGRAEAVRGWIRDAPCTALHLAPAAFIDGGGRTLGTWHCPLPRRGDLSSAFVTERLLVQNFIAAPAPVFRKDAWLACGGVDETLWYTADWDVWLKLAALGPVCYRDLVTVGFRLHPDSLTATGSIDSVDFHRQLDTVLARHLSKVALASRRGIERVAQVSIAVNVGLAASAKGRYRGLLVALVALLGLGPVGIRRYWRDSRIAERVLPRLKARWAGAS